MPCTKCQQSYLDSYNVALDGVKKSDPTISEHEARVKVAQLFRPKFHVWQETAKVEMRGDKEYQNGEFAFNDRGEMYYLKTGETAEGLHVNQKRLSELPDHSSDEYSVEDHLITCLIQSALREGATQVVTSYGRTDGKNRDVLEFNYDQISKRGFIRVLNTESNGHCRSFDEIKQIAKTKYSNLQETKTTDKVFVLSDKPLEEYKARQTIVHLEQRVGYAMKETATAVGKNTLREVKQTAISIERYIRRKQDARLKKIPLMASDTRIHRVRPMLEHKENKKNDGTRIKEQEKEKNTQRKIQEKIAASVATLLFVRATGIGIGGVFTPLESIVRLPQISVELPKRIKKEKKQRQKRTLEKMRVFRMSESFKKLTKKEQHAFRRKEKKIRLKEKKIFLQKERKLIRRNEKVLWIMLKRLVQKTERQFVPKKIKQKENVRKINAVKKENRTVVIQKEHQAKKQEKQHVISFSLAFVLWLLVGERYHVPLHDNKKDKRLLQRKELKKNASTPWLIFAIIWHLAMIREQGKRTAPKQKKAKKQHTQYWASPMPPAGVIFAFQP